MSVDKPSAPALPGPQAGPQAFWDARYDNADYIFGTAPNDFIRAVVPPARHGESAYAPADGEGRNGVWLARLGYGVTTSDIAPLGVRKAKALAAQAGVTIDARTADLFDPVLADLRFDLIAISFMHFMPDLRQRFHALAATQLKPGGLLVAELYHHDQLPLDSGGPKNPEMLVTPQMLEDDFSGLDIILAQSVRRILNEGPRHRGAAATVQFVARKPG